MGYQAGREDTKKQGGRRETATASALKCLCALHLDEIDGAARSSTDLLDDRLDHRSRQCGVDGQRDERVPALRVTGDLHARDVDAVLAEDLTDDADDAGPVFVPEESEVLRQCEVDVEIV